MIAKKYFFSFRIIIDVLSTFPFDHAFGSLTTPSGVKLLSAFGMLKLFRITRLGSLLQKMNISRSWKAVINMV
jgi:hypothetical protein